MNFDEIPQEFQIDICNELVAEMNRLGFNQSSIIAVQQSPHFEASVGKDSRFQKTYVTLTLSSILNSASFVAPSEIRLGLNMNGTPTDWMLDVKIIVLPFLKENEEIFFK